VLFLTICEKDIKMKINLFSLNFSYKFISIIRTPVYVGQSSVVSEMRKWNCAAFGNVRFNLRNAKIT